MARSLSCIKSFTAMVCAALTLVPCAMGHAAIVRLDGGYRIESVGCSMRLDDTGFSYCSGDSKTPDLAYKLSSVKLGRETVDISENPAIAEVDGIIQLRYSDVVKETYTPLPNGVEQCWVIERRPRASGSIVIQGRITTSLKATSSPDGLTFLDERGRPVVSYGAVTVIDSAGSKYECLPSWRQGSLSITVPQNFVDRAVFPIVIDPVVGPATPVLPSFSPAPANQDSASIAGSPDGYFAVWQDFRGSDVDIFGCRISPTGGVLDKMSIAVCSAAGDQISPSVSWNGQYYMVVWADKRSGASHIYGARVKPDGEVIEKQGILISGTTGSQSYPKITSDGAGWFVVWQDIRSSSPDIYSCKINADGALGKVLSITTRVDNEEAPDVAWNGTQYVVVWSDSRNSATTGSDIYGCRVAKNGIRTAGDIIVSCSSTGSSGASGDQRFPRICSQGSICTVVWEDARNGVDSDIYGTRFTSAAQILDKNGIVICNGSGDQEQPNVAYNGSKLLVSWRNRVDRIVKAARLNTSGQVLDSQPVSVSSGMAGSYGTALAASGNRFIVGWSSLDAINSNTIAALVNDNGTVQSPGDITVSYGLDDQTDYAVVDNGTDYVAVWSQLVNGSYDILAAKISRTGEMTTQNPVNITSVFAGDQTQPSIAWNGSTYLVVWRGNESYASTGWDIRGCLLDSGLNLIGSAALSVGVGMEEQGRPCVASNGSNFLVAWEDRRLGVSPNYYYDLFGAIVSSTGTVTQTSAVLSAANNNQLKPKVASDGSGYLAVWEDYRSGVSMIYGARVSSTGQLLDTQGIALPATYSYQTTPSVCFGGGNYLVVWSDWYKITGCRISTGGQKLDTAGIVVCVSTSQKSSPSARWDGAKYLAAWEDYRSSYYGNADIYCASVDANGTASTDSETALISDLSPQYRPLVFASGASGMLFYSNYFNHANCIYAAVLTDEGVQQIEDIATAKQLGSGSLVALSGKIVTGVFSGYFYIEELNRSSGIKVISSEPVQKGNVVDVTGTVSIADGERQITTGVMAIMGIAGEPIRPIGIRGDMLGGAALNANTPGISGGVGAHNMGLLVTTWGKVTATGSGSFTLEVKPGVSVKVKSGSFTKPATGKFVQVTGISSCEILSGSIGRALLVTQQSDIVILK